MTAIDVAGRKIGHGHPVFVIAEAGVNHNGELQLAEELVDAASEAGADAVKFQTFSADRLVTRTAAKAQYQQQTTGGQESQYTMLQRLELTIADHERLFARAQQRGVLFLSTPFDQASADLLFELDVPAVKVGSGDLTNLPLLRYLARHGKPIILSTGMAYLGEVEEAVHCIQEHSDAGLVLLHCVSDYPAHERDVNLRAMNTLARVFGLAAGYSDHTLGIAIPIAAVALGACVIEKHLTLDRSLPGPDHRLSLEPRQFSAMVKAIRDVESCLGDGIKRPTASEQDVARAARKSVVSIVDISQGTAVTADMLAIKRPGTGIPPRDLEKIEGRIARITIPADTVLQWEMF